MFSDEKMPLVKCYAFFFGLDYIQRTYAFAHFFSYYYSSMSRGLAWAFILVAFGYGLVLRRLSWLTPGLRRLNVLV